MTYYERERNKQTSGMHPIQGEATIRLEDSVVRGNRVTRVAHVSGPDTPIRIEHHLFGFPGIQPGGWPVTLEYTGNQVNRARLWTSGGKRLIWRPTPKR